MKLVLQRVAQAFVEVEEKVVARIERGVLVYLAVLQGDTEKEVAYLAQKVCEFRIFPDTALKMNLSLLDVQGSVLVVSQFTLAADGKKGKRPSFDLAAPPEHAQKLYLKFIESLQKQGITTQQGVFGASMQVFSINDGPVTFVLEKMPERHELKVQ